MDIESANSGGAASPEMGNIAGENGEDYSPFKPPNEEQVFITREAEKQKKKEAKEAAKHLKIWDKKTATSRMPLQRVKEQDIKPAPSDDQPSYNYNATQRGIISNAMHIAKSRVQFPRESRPQNISEFVDQKKEMFLVEMSYNTIKEEITSLQLKTNRKLTALQESDITLERDNNKLVKFIEDDNKTTGERTKDADAATQERKKTEAKIKNIDSKIQNIMSDIDRNNDQLTALQEHKDFLFAIFEKENAKWCDSIVKERERKKNTIMREWIEFHKLHKNRLQEDEFGGESSKPAGEQPVIGRRGKGQQAAKEMTEQEWIAKFEEHLNADRVDVGEDFFEEDILFDDPEQLSDIYAYLEEINLKRIRESQDLEEQLETEKYREIKVQSDIGGAIAIQEQAKFELAKTTNMARATLMELQRQSNITSKAKEVGAAHAKKNDDEDQDVNIDALMDNLKQDIFYAYNNSDYAVGNATDMAGKQAIQLLHEIELKISGYANEIEYIQNAEKMADNTHDKNIRAKWYKKLEQQEGLRKAARFEKQKLIRDEAERAKKEKVQKNLDERMQRQVKKVGKQVMYRSEKPKVKQETVKKVIDEDTQDQIMYLGNDLKSLSEQAQALASAKK